MLSSMSFPLLHTPPEDHIQYYIVDDIHQSENAVLLFCANTAIKKLLPYKDQRYNLEKVRDRQSCLLEGLKWNRKFTSGVHIGLARIYRLEAEKIEKLASEKSYRVPDLKTLIQRPSMCW